MKFSAILIAVIGLVLLLLIPACIMPSANVVTSPDADLSSVKTVVVWQFQDGGRVANTGAIATRALEAALLKRGWRLVPFSRMRDILSLEVGFREGMALDAGMLTPTVLNRLKNEVGAEAILLGSVSDAWCDPMWIPACWIECAFQLVSTADGSLMISGNAGDDGSSLQAAATQMAEKAIGKIRR